MGKEQQRTPLSDEREPARAPRWSGSNHAWTFGADGSLPAEDDASRTTPVYLSLWAESDAAKARLGGIRTTLGELAQRATGGVFAGWWRVDAGKGMPPPAEEPWDPELDCGFGELRITAGACACACACAHACSWE